MRCGRSTRRFISVPGLVQRQILMRLISAMWVRAKGSSRMAMGSMPRSRGRRHRGIESRCRFGCLLWLRMTVRRSVSIRIPWFGILLGFMFLVG